MKFNKKVVICMIMILSMLLGGCGTSLGSSVKKVKLDPDNPTKVTIWHYYNGNQYIKSAAEVFVESVPENTLISRPGGDEFYILFYGYSSRSEIQRYLDQLEKDIRAQSILLPNGDPFMLHLSAGVAWYPDDTTDRKEFTQYADFAMYQIKRTVKDQFGDFDKEAYRTSQEQYNKEKD